MTVSLTYSQVYALARSVGCTATQGIVATAIAKAESDFNPHNVGDKTLAKYGSRGLWQIFSGAHSLKELKIKSYDELFDPNINAKAMWLISNHGKTWRPWSTYNNRSHIKFMAQATAAAVKLGAKWPAYLPGVPATLPTGPDPVVPTVSLARAVKAATVDPGASQGQGAYPENTILIEKALAAEALLDKRYEDGAFGTETIKAYSRWQKKMKFKGKDANGVPGLDTLRALGNAHGFAVTIK